MTIQEKAQSVVEQAKSLAADASSWMDFSNKIFADNGVVAKTFPRMTERKAFYELPQYEQVNEILLSLIKRFGLGDGHIQKKSGKFVVRIPKSLHAALDVEAEYEGVSLNQLALAKLSVPLDNSAGLTTSLVVQAFTNVYDGYASDRIIVDDEYNSRFLRECHKLGLAQSDCELNLLLQRIRKSGKSALPPATNKPRITDYDEFVFASEIAFRHLQINENVSLDRVLCDPDLRKRFDEIAKLLAPHKDYIKLRMGALYLRKTHRLKPGDASLDLRLEELVRAGKISELAISDIPDFPGMYAFYDGRRPVFAGETAQLRHRVELHLASAENMFLPSWLEMGCESALELKTLTVPKISKDSRLSWLNQFINKERPPLNYQAA